MKSQLVVPEDDRGDEQRGSVRAGPACLCRCRSKLDPPHLFLSPSRPVTFGHSAATRANCRRCWPAAHTRRSICSLPGMSPPPPRVPRRPAAQMRLAVPGLQDASEWLRWLSQGLFRTSCNTSFILRSSQRFCFTGQILIQKITYQIQRRQTFYNSLCIK